MEYLNESIVLGVDVIVLGLCLHEYYKYKNTVQALKSAPQLNIDENLKIEINKQPDKKIPYAVLRGTVTPIGTPLRSVLSPSVTGVLQVIKLSEHRIARGFAGFWTEQRKLIHVSSNEIPFMISSSDKKIGVEILDGLSAEILDLDTVYDNYEPTSLSFFDHIFGFASGIRQRGMQTTEEVLRDGSFITAVGELELDGNNLRLQTSKLGPMLLTTSTRSTLIKKFESAKSSMMFKVVICSAISFVLIGIIAKRYYNKRKQDRNERELIAQLEKTRLERRTKQRQIESLTDDQRCVVCFVNPKEVICLPCGHVCLCEDCSRKIKLSCPVCKGKIQTKAAAFIV